MFQCCLSACEVLTHKSKEVLESKVSLFRARRSVNRIPYDFQLVSNLRKMEIFKSFKGWREKVASRIEKTRDFFLDKKN